MDPLSDREPDTTEAEQAEFEQQEADALRNALARRYVIAQHRRFDGTTWGEL